MHCNHSLTWRISVVLCIILTVAQTGLPQQQPASGSDAADAGQQTAPPLKQEELEQLLAPIALYPDSLLTQMLMASTYPLEIVQADRWAKANKDLKGDALATQLEKQPWDPSVKSLVNFPDQLSMMSEKLDLTIKLGDAFISQQSDVMNTIQVLRNKAQQQGNLKSSDQLSVTTAPAPAPVVVQQPAPQVTVVQAPPQVITIESASPDVIYVPTYSPTVVYGAWPYPAYPPYPYYPPYPSGYFATAAISFGVGVACGAAWGYAWGHSNWGGGNVDIDVNRNNNFNRNIDRSKYQNNFQNRQNNFQNGKGNWQHSPAHRDGVPYRDQATSNKFGQGNQSRQTAQARDAYRGRADAGRQDIARGGADQYRGNNPGGAANRPGAGGGGVQNRPAGGAGAGGAQNRPAAGGGAQNRPAGGAGAAQNRPAASPANRPTGGNSGAFGGVDRGGAAARSASQRGNASRSASPSARPAPSRSAPARSGGGGRTGGGGGRR